MEESGKEEWTRKQTRASVPYLLPDLQLDEAGPEHLVGAVRQGPGAQQVLGHRRTELAQRAPGGGQVL